MKRCFPVFRIFLTTVVLVTLVIITIAANVALPEVSENVAVDQMDLTNESAVMMRTWASVNNIVSLMWVGFLVFLLLLWRSVLMDFGRKILGLAGCLCLLLGSVGCRPFDVPEFEEVGTSETAFLIPLEGDMEEQKSLDVDALKENIVVAKRVQIPHRWVQTGRMYWSGNYVDTVRLIKVDRAPVTVRIEDSIWVESRDSVGFSTGLTVTARIPDNEDAVKFLRNYPGDSLDEVLSDEVKERALKVMAREAGKADMDELRALKNEIDTAIEEGTVPFFAERGIEITNISIFGGYTYENPKIQESIDKVFAAQQDKNVAIAEFEAAEQRKAALKASGEGEAAKVLEAKRGEAEGIKLVADAKAYEISQLQSDPESYLQLKRLEIQKMQMEKWDGKFPHYMMTGGEAPDLLMNIPVAGE